jgi:hypothetical protein
LIAHHTKNGSYCDESEELRVPRRKIASINGGKSTPINALIVVGAMHKKGARNLIAIEPMNETRKTLDTKIAISINQSLKKVSIQQN